MVMVVMDDCSTGVVVIRNIGLFLVADTILWTSLCHIAIRLIFVRHELGERNKLQRVY